VRLLVSRILEAADPARLVRGAVGSAVPLEHTAVIAVGKAAPRMFSALPECVGSRIMVVPEGVEAPAWALRADHPLPTERNIRAAGAVREFVGKHNRGAGFLVLISGGASALLTRPVPPLTLNDLRQVTHALLASNADITQINCVRKHIEQLKGGRLGLLMAPAPVHALALSDVIGDDPASIGSGPVSPDPTTYAEALRIVEGVSPECGGVLTLLRRGGRGELPETPKPGDGSLAHITLRIVGNNAAAMEGARRGAEELGFRVVQVEGNVTGEAADAGRRLARAALRAREGGGSRVCIVFGGETTVSLGRGAGRGGRNQEMALAAALELEGHEGIVIAAFATDGVDGPTDAAGAIATGETCSLARAAGLDPSGCLGQHDSYALFDAIGGLIRTGPTGTNVSDVALALIW
jgi:glycerate 2-kinase